MQVIILVDCSGSMSAAMNGIKKNVEIAFEAAVGAAYGLTAGRSEVAIYGHTGEIDGHNVIIYNVKSFTDPISSVAAKAGAALQERMSQNLDGFAIQYVAKKFTSLSKRRVMIVISDGAPLSSNYSGASAIKHSQEVVNGVRKSGVSVYSISINSMAARINNVIYGKENNIVNDDPNVIGELTKSLMTE
jgi:nitric oxide reductase NorD protein